MAVRHLKWYVSWVQTVDALIRTAVSANLLAHERFESRTPNIDHCFSFFVNEIKYGRLIKSRRS